MRNTLFCLATVLRSRLRNHRPVPGRAPRFRVGVALGLLLTGVAIDSAAAQPVKNRISVLVDSSQSMLLTPEIVTFPETCVANQWNGCTSSGNPTAAQET